MRYANTKQGGLRNIFIDRGMMVFVTTYHKNYQSSGKMKIIHRYLPQEVGEILFRYLWLVLPFWQAVQSVVEQADQLSPFVWSDAVQAKEEPQEEQQDEQGEEQREEYREEHGEEHREEYREEHGEERRKEAGSKEYHQSSFKTMHRSKQWTSERIRKIMQKQSEKWLGQILNISA